MNITQYPANLLAQIKVRGMYFREAEKEKNHSNQTFSCRIRLRDLQPIRGTTYQFRSFRVRGFEYAAEARQPPNR